MKSLSMLTKFIVILGLFSLAACSSPEEEAKSAGIQSIAPVEAQKKFKAKEAVIIDVREQGEWDEKHIPGAIHIPVAQLGTRLSELEQYKNSPVIMQCHSGMRSAQGAVLLHSAGFKQVYNLDGGIVAWGKEGLEME